MGILKAVEQFFRGIGRAGVTYRRAKFAERAVREAEQRLDALQNTLNASETGLSARVEAVESELAIARRATGAEPGSINDRLDFLEQQLGIDAGPAKAPVIDRVVEVEQALFASQRERAAAFGQALARLDAVETGLSRAGAEHALLSRAYTDLGRRLDLLRFGRGERAPDALATDAPRPPEGLDALLEAFYARLEDRFRGSREEIKRRLLPYLDDARAARERCGPLPVLDLGCGRGEWLELLRDGGIEAEGVDLNPQQLADARAAGLTVREGDAMAHLAEAPDGAFSMVTAHHLVEHVPFDRVAAMTREALRVLAPGGILLYETPDPRNVLVGATSFHVDPTHLKPLPEEVLTVLLDTIGFHPVEGRRLNPHERRDEFVERHGLDPEVATLLFGPQDLAVLGTKPAPES